MLISLEKKEGCEGRREGGKEGGPVLFVNLHNIKY